MISALDQAGLTPLAPYGVVLDGGGGADVTALDPARLERLALEHRVVVLRGFAPLERDGFEAFGRRFGALLEWNFGFVLDLVVHDTPSNYLFTRGNVPYHWDGAFAEVVPRHQLFQCREAPAPGSGETTFCDTVRVVERATPAQRAAWARIAIEYRTDKQAHYGGEIRRPLLQPHPLTGATTIRFAEPLNDESVQLNPLFLQIFEDGVALGRRARAGVPGRLRAAAVRARGVLRPPLASRATSSSPTTTRCCTAGGRSSPARGATSSASTSSSESEHGKRVRCKTGTMS